MKILGEKQAALKIVVDDLDSLKAQLLVRPPSPCPSAGGAPPPPLSLSERETFDSPLPIEEGTP